MRIYKMVKRGDEVIEGYQYGIGDYKSFFTGQKHCYKQLYYLSIDKPIPKEYLALYFKLKRPKSAQYHLQFTSDSEYQKHYKQRQITAYKEFQKQIKLNKGFI